jgi:hypothetical protein
VSKLRALREEVRSLRAVHIKPAESTAEVPVDQLANKPFNQPTHIPPAVEPEQDTLVAKTQLNTVVSEKALKDALSVVQPEDETLSVDKTPEDRPQTMIDWTTMRTDC